MSYLKKLYIVCIILFGTLIAMLVKLSYDVGNLTEELEVLKTPKRNLRLEAVEANLMELSNTVNRYKEVQVLNALIEHCENRKVDSRKCQVTMSVREM